MAKLGQNSPQEEEETRANENMKSYIRCMREEETSRNVLTDALTSLIRTFDKMI